MNDWRQGAARTLAMIGSALFLFAGCAGFSRQATYPAYYAPPPAEQALFQCDTVASRRLWYVLWGSYSLNRPDPEQLFSSGAGVYRIVERKTGGDLAISMLLGFVFSVTTSHLEYQSCTARGYQPGRAPAKAVSRPRTREPEQTPADARRDAGPGPAPIAAPAREKREPSPSGSGQESAPTAPPKTAPAVRPQDGQAPATTPSDLEARLEEEFKEFLDE